MILSLENLKKYTGYITMNVIDGETLDLITKTKETNPQLLFFQSLNLFNLDIDEFIIEYVGCHSFNCTLIKNKQQICLVSGYRYPKWKLCRTQSWTNQDYFFEEPDIYFDNLDENQVISHINDFIEYYNQKKNL